jgi:hypothetical protein
VQCVVNGGRGSDGRPDPLLTCRRVIGTYATSTSLIPLCSNETAERDANVGWVALFNQLIESLA